MKQQAHDATTASPEDGRETLGAKAFFGCLRFL